MRSINRIPAQQLSLSISFEKRTTWVCQWSCESLKDLPKAPLPNEDHFLTSLFLVLTVAATVQRWKINTAHFRDTPLFNATRQLYLLDVGQ